MTPNIPSYVPAEYSLAGRTAIVASCGGDETAQLAAALAEAGANVFAVARHHDSVDAIRATVSSVTGVEAFGYVGRWDTPGTATAVLSAFFAAHDRADILVNDTRSFFAKPAVEISAGCRSTPQQFSPAHTWIRWICRQYAIGRRPQCGGVRAATSTSPWPMGRFSCEAACLSGGTKNG